MSVTSNPLTMWRAAGAVAVLASAGAASLLGWWAFAPLDVQTPEANAAGSVDDGVAIGAVASSRIDPAMFARWFGDDRGPAAPLAPPPPREPAFASGDRSAPFELLGVIENATSLQAALFDVKENKVVILASGGEIGGHRVTMITRQTVDVSDGTNSWRLTLRTPSTSSEQPIPFTRPRAQQGRVR